MLCHGLADILLDFSVFWRSNTLLQQLLAEADEDEEENHLSIYLGYLRHDFSFLPTTQPLCAFTVKRNLKLTLVARQKLYKLNLFEVALCDNERV